MDTVIGLLILATVGWARHMNDVPQHILDDGSETSGIINGKEAYPGQFPYMGALEFVGQAFCSGVLVDRSWFAVSWYCVPQDPRAYRVHLGIHNLGDFGNGGQHEVYDVVATVRHPDHDVNTGAHSIALVQLAKPVSLDNPFIQQAPLAPDNDDDYLDANCFISGWKLAASDDPLKYANTTVQTASDCDSVAGEGFISPTSICAFNGETGPCDINFSTSALICKREGVTYVVGIFQWPRFLCDETYPAAYTLMSVHRDWIKSVIE